MVAGFLPSTLNDNRYIVIIIITIETIESLGMIGYMYMRKKQINLQFAEDELKMLNDLNESTFKSRLKLTAVIKYIINQFFNKENK